jgi:hypothetical protein
MLAFYYACGLVDTCCWCTGCNGSSYVVMLLCYHCVYGSVVN